MPALDRADRLGPDRRAAVRQIVAVDRGDHGVVEPQRLDRFADAARLVEVERRRLAVATAQKPQARVQMSPRIMKVAVRGQHSPMLGQRASSQTVCSSRSRMVPRSLR